MARCVAFAWLSGLLEEGREYWLLRLWKRVVGRKPLAVLAERGWIVTAVV